MRFTRKHVVLTSLIALLCVMLLPYAAGLYARHQLLASLSLLEQRAPVKFTLDIYQIGWLHSTAEGHMTVLLPVAKPNTLDIPLNFDIKHQPVLSETTKEGTQWFWGHTMVHFNTPANLDYEGQTLDFANNVYTMQPANVRGHVTMGWHGLSDSAIEIAPLSIKAQHFSLLWGGLSGQFNDHLSTMYQSHNLEIRPMLWQYGKQFIKSEAIKLDFVGYDNRQHLGLQPGRWSVEVPYLQVENVAGDNWEIKQLDLEQRRLPADATAETVDNRLLWSASAKHLQYNDVEYNNFNGELALKKVTPAGLRKLSAQLQQALSSFGHSDVDGFQFYSVLYALSPPGSEWELKRLLCETPQGPLKLDAKANWLTLETADAKAGSLSVEANAHIKVAKPLLKRWLKTWYPMWVEPSKLISQAHAPMSTDALIEEQLQQWESARWLRRQEDQYVVDVDYVDNALRLNGHPYVAFASGM